MLPPGRGQRVDGPKSWSKWRSAQSSAATAAAAAARQLALLKAHLVHHPSDHDGWMALADHLDVVKDLALNDAAKHVPSAEWRASESASELARGLRLRIRRACHAAVASATTDAQRVAAHERAGLAAFEEVSEVPPFHDGRGCRLPRDDPARRAALGLCREAFDDASELAPTEWSYRCLGAKIARKLGAAPGSTVERLAESARLAPGNLEAFYQLHAARVKALLATRGDGETDATETLVVVAKHARNPKLARLGAANAKTSDPELLPDSSPFTAPGMWESLWEDAVGAVAACADAAPLYHKAHYRLAWATLRNPAGAVGPDSWRRVAEARAAGLDPTATLASDAMRALFKSSPNVSNSGNPIGPPKLECLLTEIDAESCAESADTSSRAFGEHGDFEIETIGINESARKYVASLRKALRLYVCAQFALGDFRSLVAVASFVSDERNKLAKTCADLGALAFGFAARCVSGTIRDLGGDVGGAARDTPAPDLAYWLWVERGAFAGGVRAWDESVRRAGEEIAFEARVGSKYDAGDAFDPDAPAALLGDAFSKAAEGVEGAPTDGATFEAYAKAHVEALREDVEIASLWRLYRDAKKRHGDAEKSARREKTTEETASAEALRVAAELKLEVHDALVEAITAGVDGEDIDAMREAAAAAASLRRDAETERESARKELQDAEAKAAALSEKTTGEEGGKDAPAASGPGGEMPAHLEAKAKADARVAEARRDLAAKDRGADLFGDLVVAAVKSGAARRGGGAAAEAGGGQGEGGGGGQGGQGEGIQQPEQPGGGGRCRSRRARGFRPGGGGGGGGRG